MRLHTIPEGAIRKVESNSRYYHCGSRTSYLRRDRDAAGLITCCCKKDGSERKRVEGKGFGLSIVQEEKRRKGETTITKGGVIFQLQ